MEEKTIQRIKKLQALAERGVGGEKETAAKMLQRLLEKNGISTLEGLEKDEEEYRDYTRCQRNSEGGAWKRTTSSAGSLYENSTRFTDRYRRAAA